MLIYFGNPAIALLLGMAFTLILDRPLVEGGNKFGKIFLQTAIVLLGFKLSMTDLWQVSANYTLPVILYVGSALSLGLLVGFLGSFTTFSTFAMDSLHWIDSGAILKSISYILLSVLFCLLGAWAGLATAKQII